MRYVSACNKVWSGVIVQYFSEHFCNYLLDVQWQKMTTQYVDQTFCVNTQQVQNVIIVPWDEDDIHVFFFQNSV